MSHYLICFLVSFVASLLADVLVVGLLAIVNDELETIRRELND